MATSENIIGAITEALLRKIEIAESLQEESMQVFEKTSLAQDEYKEYSAQMISASYMRRYLNNVLTGIIKGKTIANARKLLRQHAFHQRVMSAGADESDVIAFSKGIIADVLSDIHNRYFAA